MGNNIDKVCTGLYVGGLMGATKKEALKEHNITHVLTLLEGSQPHFPDDFKYKCIHVADNASCDLSQFFAECADYIHQCRLNGGSCYVHCAAGISRAVTICTMYILTVSTLNYEEAMTVMQYCRRVAGPNFGFRMQLKKYCRTILPEERKRLKDQYPPDSTLNDDSELRTKLKEAEETFAKNGRPPRPGDDDTFIEPDTLQD